MILRNLEEREQMHVDQLWGSYFKMAQGLPGVR